MYGKDLTEAILSNKICRTWKKSSNGRLELFLDEKEKISKSKGNGISIEQWLKIYHQKAYHYICILTLKSEKLYSEVVPKTVDITYH